MFKKGGRNVLAAGLLLIFSFLPVTWVRGAVNSCYAEATPQSVHPNTTSNFQARIINNSNDTIRWIEVSRPSADFTINSVSAPGWNGSSAGDNAVLTNGSISSGGQLYATITATVANIESPTTRWVIQVSDNSGGGASTNCSGSLGVNISNDKTPVISSITVTAISATSVTINWLTDEPATSLVNYDLTDEYNNSSDFDASLKTSHSVKLTSLEPNTAYHYQVLSADGVGQGAISSDNTFQTLATEPALNNPSPILTQTPIPIKAVPTEKQPPVIHLTTTFTNPYKDPPQIGGTASDNDALAGIFYSIDGGKNWQLVDVTTGLGTKRATFVFTPQNLEDGNYEILARAVDTSGNSSVTAPVTLVIDRLPPRVGGSVISIGSQTASRGRNGEMIILAGLDQKITLGAVGGPTNVQLRVKKID